MANNQGQQDKSQKPGEQQREREKSEPKRDTKNLPKKK
jgi:hypothetical protein